MTKALEVLIAQYRARLENKLQQLLQQQRNDATSLPAQQQLIEVAEYAALDSGKRLRAMLVYLTAHCIHERAGDNIAAVQSSNAIDCAAAAVELVHCYSLVHDDLPAMDDDDLRRGKPSCHIAFGEANAILAGDALQALAFQALADSDSDCLRAQLQVLAKASGSLGMVGGQAVDLAATGDALSLERLCDMHRLKTGALIECAVALGALCAAADQTTRAALQDYAQALGLAFQIQDDVLDVSGSPALTGKAQGADAALDKPTFTSLMGLDAARDYARQTVVEAIEALAPLGTSAEPLAALADYVVHRQQ